VDEFGKDFNLEEMTNVETFNPDKQD